MPPPGLNITIISYLFYAADFLPIRPYCGPALELGVQRLRNVYGFNATLKYVGDPSIKNVPDIVANVYRVTDFYFNKWNRNGVFAMIVLDEISGQQYSKFKLDCFFLIQELKKFFHSVNWGEVSLLI